MNVPAFATSFINTALNEVALNPQPLPPKDDNASKYLWSLQIPEAQAVVSSKASGISYDDFCGTQPRPLPHWPSGPGPIFF